MLTIKPYSSNRCYSDCIIWSTLLLCLPTSLDRYTRTAAAAAATRNTMERISSVDFLRCAAPRVYILYTWFAYDRPDCRKSALRTRRLYRPCLPYSALCTRARQWTDTIAILFGRRRR